VIFESSKQKMTLKELNMTLDNMDRFENKNDPINMR